jgi:hypothetical protein
MIEQRGPQQSRLNLLGQSERHEHFMRAIIWVLVVLCLALSAAAPYVLWAKATAAWPFSP